MHKSDLKILNIKEEHSEAPPEYYEELARRTVTTPTKTKTRNVQR